MTGYHFAKALGVSEIIVDVNFCETLLEQVFSENNPFEYLDSRTMDTKDFKQQFMPTNTVTNYLVLIWIIKVLINLK